jgi:outer membrane protein assembly factor BamA
VIAFRALGEFTDPRRGQFVPFYLQPNLGGPDNLRGYRAYRFYDNTAVVATAEYRCEIFSGLDMALFADAGNVFPRWQDIKVTGVKTDAGFGFRFNVRNNVFMRLDTGFSREGFQVWFNFANIF